MLWPMSKENFAKREAKRKFLFRPKRKTLWRNDIKRQKFAGKKFWFSLRIRRVGFARNPIWFFNRVPVCENCWFLACSCVVTCYLLFKRLTEPWMPSLWKMSKLNFVYSSNVSALQSSNLYNLFRMSEAQKVKIRISSGPFVIIFNQTSRSSSVTLLFSVIFARKSLSLIRFIQ